MKEFEILSRSPVFKGIGAVELHRLLKRVKYGMKSYKKGQTIAFSGDPCESLLILLSGLVKGQMTDYSGKAVEVGTIEAPGPIAPAFLFGDRNRFPVDAVVQEDSRVLVLPRASLVYLMQLNPAVLTNFLDVVSTRTHFLTERLWFMSFKTIKEKFAHYLLKLLKPAKPLTDGVDKVVLPKSQQELSRFFGVSRPSLARVIGEMEKEGILECRRRDVYIKDFKRLQKLVE